MISIFREYPFITSIAMVLAFILSVFMDNIEPRFGEIMGMQMVFSFIVFGIMTILWIMLTILKSCQPRKIKNQKKRARTGK